MFAWVRGVSRRWPASLTEWKKERRKWRIDGWWQCIEWDISAASLPPGQCPCFNFPPQFNLSMQNWLGATLKVTCTRLNLPLDLAYAFKSPCLISFPRSAPCSMPFLYHILCECRAFAPTLRCVYKFLKTLNKSAFSRFLIYQHTCC